MLDWDMLMVIVVLWYVDLLWFFFFKQKTAYEMRISDWSSDVCSSDLVDSGELGVRRAPGARNPWSVRRTYRIAAGDRCPVGIDSGTALGRKIGRASGRERVCKYVYI